MTKIIVPTDFSDTSKNAAEFAIKMTSDLPGAEVTLYNCFDKVAVGSDGTPLSEESDARMQITMMALQNLKERLDTYSGVKINIFAEEGPLIPNLENLVKKNNPDIVVMGINGATRIEQILIGSSTLGFNKPVNCSVMIIPPNAKYRKIRKVVFTSDMNDVETTTPVEQLRKVLDIFGPRLLVTHVSHDYYLEVTPALKAERKKLDNLLQGYVAEYHYLPWADFTESINRFAEENEADLVITVPRKHSFVNKVFTTSHTKKLAYHSHLPVLALPDLR
jgi:nucleotide-binding universal stress UspA family protein